MLRAITFHGKKQFTAEYYATEVKNRSYSASQDDGYYKDYGNELRYAIIGDRTFRINSGLFTVQGRQCAVVLGTQEDIIVPSQEQAIKCYIIARINTNILSGDNVELDYKLGTTSAFPSLTQQETYSIAENESAIYELPLYSFTIYRSITNVVKMIKPLKNMQVQIDTNGVGVSDYLFENGLYVKKIPDTNYYEFYEYDGTQVNKLPINADFTSGGKVVKSITKSVENNVVTYTYTYSDNTTSTSTISKTDIGLSNVDNTSDANKPISTATQTALNGKVPTSRTVNGKALSSNISLTKSDIGLSNVDNTSDANKPISTATQNALNSKADLVNGKLPLNQLPDTGITVDNAKAVAYGTNSTYSGDKIKNNDDKLFYNLQVGDTLTESNGVLIVGRQTIKKNMGELSWTYIGSFICFRATLPNVKSGTTKAVCLGYKYYSGNYTTLSNKQFTVIGTYIYLKDTGYNNATLLTNALAGLYIYYEASNVIYNEYVTYEQSLNNFETNTVNWLKEEWNKGLNLWDEQFAVGKIYNGVNTSYPTEIRSVNYIEVIPNERYSFNRQVYVSFYDSNYQFIQVSSPAGELVTLEGFNVPSNAKYMRFYTSGDYGATYNNDIALFKGNVVYPYISWIGSLVREKQFNALKDRVNTLENKRTYQHTITYTDTVDIGLGGTLDIKVIFSFFSDYNVECISINDLEIQLDEQKPYLASGSKALYLSSEFQGRTSATFVVYENGDVNVYYDDGASINIRGTGYLTDSITRIV